MSNMLISVKSTVIYLSLMFNLIHLCQTIDCNFNQFKCVQKDYCIPIGWKCDRDNDCGDNTDEQFCEKSKCTFWERMSGRIDCDDQSACLTKKQKCDGVSQCADRSDEAGCVVEKADCGLVSAKYPPKLTVKSSGQIFLAQLRIVGGEEANEHSWPWMAALYIGRSQRCGATLINNGWAVTAAHCALVNSLRSYRIKLGAHTKGNSQSTASDKEKICGIQRIVRHPNYRQPRSNSNDIALLQLSCDFSTASPVAYSDEIQPICLPKATDSFQVQAVSTSQSSQNLREALLVSVPISSCARVFGASVDNSMMCASQRGKDTCQGDSGGPILARRENRWVLAGITSWGVGCARPNYPGVYTHVPTMLDWIQQTIN